MMVRVEVSEYARQYNVYSGDWLASRQCCDSIADNAYANQATEFGEVEVRIVVGLDSPRKRLH